MTESPAIPKSVTPRSAEYLSFVRQHKCAVHGCYREPVRACHEKGLKGKARKPPDTLSIPLCDDHHNLAGDSIHRLGKTEFQRVHDIDLNEVVAELLHEWVTGRVGDVMHFG